MKKILASAICALWLFVLYKPTVISADPETSLLFIIFLDILLFAMWVGFAGDWIKNRKNGLVAVALAMVLVSHLLLVPLTGMFFDFVAIVPMVFFWSVVAVSFFCAKKKSGEVDTEIDGTGCC